MTLSSINCDCGTLGAWPRVKSLMKSLVLVFATVANYRQTVLTAFQQVEDSLAQLRTLSQEAEIAEIMDRAIQAVQQSLEISTIQYRGGIANYLLVITSPTSALQNQRSTVDIPTRRRVASVSLIQALGGGWDASQLLSSQDLKR
jgi:outer membrane protein TolC